MTTLGYASGESGSRQQLAQRENPHGDVKDVILAGDVGGTNSRFMLYEADTSMRPHSGQR
jgi:hexokinase